MQKYVVVGLLILLAGGGYFYTQNNQPTMEKTSVVVTEPQESPTTQSRRYLPFTTDVLASATSMRRILFFYASWCPTCIPADKDFEQNASLLPEDVLLIRVNYNDPETDTDERALARKYGITYQHTYVQIDGDGKEITLWNGGGMSELLAKIK